MLGNESGFPALMKQDILHLQGNHYFLQIKNLASKTLLPKLKKVLDIFLIPSYQLECMGRAVDHRSFKITQ